MVRTGKDRLVYTARKKLQSLVAVLVAAFGCMTCSYATDAFDTAGTVANNLGDKLFTLAEVLFPLALIICLLLILFAHDERVIKGAWKGMALTCVAFAMIYLVHQGTIVTTIENLFGGGGG